MAEGRPLRDRIGAIAGIEIIHQLAPRFQLSALPVEWPNDPPSDAPIVIAHAVGDVSVEGMRHVMDIGARVSYYAGNSRETAIRISNLERKGPVHMVRSLEPGFAYNANYEFCPTTAAYRRDIEICAFADALAVRGTRLMAHGCGAILADGRGALCLGKSGAGKSTTFRMLDGRSGARVLNDDRLVIERRGDGFQLWSTPWPGNAGIARSGDAPLGVIALIGRGDRHAVRVLSPREALPRVLPTLALPIWNPDLMASRLDFVGSLVEHVPILEMAYPLDETTPGWMAATLREA